MKMKNLTRIASRGWALLLAVALLGGQMALPAKAANNNRAKDRISVQGSVAADEAGEIGPGVNLPAPGETAAGTDGQAGAEQGTAGMNQGAAGADGQAGAEQGATGGTDGQAGAEQGATGGTDGQAGAEQGTAGTDGQAGAEQGAAGGTDGQAGAEQGTAGADSQAGVANLPKMRANYDGFISQVGWSPIKDDNTICLMPSGRNMTGIRVALTDVPADLTGTVSYQVYMSGAGWLDWAANWAETGTTTENIPIESIRIKLIGDLANYYDIYYAVRQNGAWTEWSVNEAPSGVEGAGMPVDGFRVSVVYKGAEAPQKDAGVDPGRPMVALTFDDGPSTAVTTRILNSLEAHGGRATFFMVGNRVPGTRACVQRMVDLGCQVGNHTYEHKYLTKIGDSGIRSQVGLTNQKIAEACGVAPIVVRPPGGYYNQASLNTLGSMGMSAIMWNIDTRDWQTRNAQKTIDAVLNHVQDGDIVLMHDIYGATADAVEVIVPELVRRGYQLVTVSEMAEYRGGMAAGHVYNKFRP